MAKPRGCSGLCAFPFCRYNENFLIAANIIYGRSLASLVSSGTLTPRGPCLQFFLFWFVATPSLDGAHTLLHSIGCGGCGEGLQGQGTWACEGETSGKLAHILPDISRLKPRRPMPWIAPIEP